MAEVFMTGGTGYIGRALATELLQRGHHVRTVVRKGSEQKVARGCGAVTADVLDGSSYAAQVGRSDTFVHLVGVAHPSPAKAAQFRSIDLVSIREAVTAASSAHVGHFVYVSVAHPAPIMKEYIAVRREGEELIRQAGLRATILRPWYVIGPGHWWPVAIQPVYWIMERIPATRAGALRLGLVSLRQFVLALASVVESPPAGVRVLEVPEIRDAARRN